MSPLQILKDKNASFTANRRGVAWLDAFERRGWLDTIIVLLTAVEGWALWHFPQTNLNIPRPWPVATGFLIWLLLALGAIAPLTRRRSAQPDDLPPIAGLWLTAYGLMFTAWAVILLNTDPTVLFGFWHLTRLDAFEMNVAICLAPLALAPGWKRAWRVARLGWLRRRRGRRQAGREINTVQSRPIRFGKVILFIAVLAVYAWLMTDYAIMSDGWGVIGFVRNQESIAANAYREPGALLMLRETHRLFQHFGLNAQQTIALVSFTAMLVVLGCYAGLMRLWAFSPRQRRAGWWLILSSLGITQMMLGRVELYPLLMASLMVTLTLGAAALAGRCSPGPMALTYALALAVHLSAIFILPAVMAVIWFWSRAQSQPGRALTRGLVYLAGWGALVHVPLWGWLMGQLDPATPASLIQAVGGSLNTGVEGETFIGVSRQISWAQLGELFSITNLFKLIQLHFLLCTGVLFIVVLIPVAAHLGGWRPIGRPDSGYRASLIVFVIAWLGYLFYAWSWRADWPWSQDWDLFSALAPLAVAAILRWLLPASRIHRLPPSLISRICLFVLALSLTQHYFNHVYIGFLSSANKSVQGKTEGRILQRYQIENTWRAGTFFEVKDGELIFFYGPPTDEIESTPSSPPSSHPASAP